MRQSEWSYDHTETVASAPERVVAWWFHADRSEELRERFGLSAAGDVSLERSVVDGVSIRDFHWKSGQGQDHHHHVETTLTDDGPPARVGDRFVVPVSDVLTFRSSSGKNMTMACDGRIEFISLAGGVTEVRVTTSTDWRVAIGLSSGLTAEQSDGPPFGCFATQSPSARQGLANPMPHDFRMNSSPGLVTGHLDLPPIPGYRRALCHLEDADRPSHYDDVESRYALYSSGGQ
jgi:hypothetical protein